MSEKPSTYAGLACLALVLASFVPGVSDAAAGLGAERQTSEGSVPGRLAARKGDLLSAPRAVARHDVASIRIEGEHASVSMRTRAGLLAYQADSAAAFSVAAKNVVLPSMPERMGAPATQSTAAQALAPQLPASPARVEPRKLPIGCERLVSVLVKSAERDRVGRCLA